MTLRFQNAHFWRPVKSMGTLSFPSDGPTAAKTVVKATVPVVLWLMSATADGEVSEPILVGYLEPGDSPVYVSHGTGFQLAFEFKGGNVAIYDDREPNVAEAPVGESFTVFEKRGIVAEDPMQVIIHRDEVRRRLERMAVERSGEPSLIDTLTAQVAGLTKILQERFPDEVDGQTEEQPAE